MLKISIPTPCHEDWEAMTPNTQGRHCNSCVKTVVDFTTMSDEEVKYFFINRKEEKVCGRFRNDQLQRITIELPHNIFYTTIPFWKKFLAACLLVFSTTLFSCDTNLQGDIVTKNEGNIQTELRTSGLPSGSKLLGDTSVIPEKICSEMIGKPSATVGFMSPQIIPDDKIIVGDIIVPEDTLPVDKPIIKIPLTKMGEVNMISKDSLQTKNSLSADSINCNKEIFY